MHDHALTTAVATAAATKAAPTVLPCRLQLHLLKALAHGREVIQKRSRERLVLVSSHDSDVLKRADVVIDLVAVEA